MLNSVDFSGRPFHFIGIGGIGMSALAYILAKRQLPVSGSDVRLSHITQRLQDQGAHIFWQQEASNLEFFSPSTVQAGAIASKASSARTVSPHLTEVPTAPSRSLSSSGSETTNGLPAHLPQVICSTAITTRNPEYQAALDLDCPIFHRSDLLAALIQDYKSIAVAGTHGKTTTSSLVAYLLMKTGLDPTIVVGGEVTAWEGNARLGQGPYLVAEADESDGSLVKLSAYIGIVTNIELDHPDHYESLDDVIGIFKTFSQRCQTLIGCIDCPNVRESLQPTITYSLDPSLGADYTASSVSYQAYGTTAQIWERGTCLGTLNLKLLGQHNLSNALSAIAVGRCLGLEFPAIAQALETFEGARRRFECRGIHRDITFIDDYAHHPSEVRVTLAAARLRVKEALEQGARSRRIVAVFQPHRYSRTLTLMADFAEAFQDADLALITDIYGAGEPNPLQISGQHLATAIADHHHQVEYCHSLEAVYQSLTSILRPGDVVLFLGAGNLNQIIPDVMEYYQSSDSDPSQEWCNLA